MTKVSVKGTEATSDGILDASDFESVCERARFAPQHACVCGEMRVDIFELTNPKLITTGCSLTAVFSQVSDTTAALFIHHFY